jgi:hypothetical protein
VRVVGGPSMPNRCRHSNSNNRPQGLYRQSPSARQPALFIIFIIYTIEIVIKILVSGFMFNPKEYSTIDRSVALAPKNFFGVFFRP